MKTKENCFKNFNDAKVILNKKTNLQVIYVRDLRASIPVCKDSKINIKHQKFALFFSYYSSKYSGLLDYLRCAIIQQSFLPLAHLFFYLIRGSHPELLYEKDVLINFKKFTGKHFCQSLFFKIGVGLRHVALLKRLWHRCFHVNFVKFLRTLFLRNTSSGCFCLIYKHWNKQPAIYK